MPDAIWVDRSEELGELAQSLDAHADRRRHGIPARTHVFPEAVPAAARRRREIWCVDTLRRADLDALVPPLTAAAPRKVIHAARQDLEAFYLTTKRVISPVFDTQIAAGCIGLKPQIGYAELVQTLLDVTLPKGQTRTDWSKRPLSPEQLEYAADDVCYLGEIAALLTERLQSARTRTAGWTEDCARCRTPGSTSPSPSPAWDGCAASVSSDRRPRRARQETRRLARDSWRGRAICRAAGSFPTRPFFSVALARIRGRALRSHRARGDPRPNFNEGFADRLLRYRATTPTDGPADAITRPGRASDTGPEEHWPSGWPRWWMRARPNSG